jgi:hypothetical protein
MEEVCSSETLENTYKSKRCYKPEDRQRQDDINLNKNINTIKKTQKIFGVSNEVGFKINEENTKYMSISRNENVGQKHSLNIPVVNKSFENVPHTAYLGRMVTNQNYFHREVTSGTNLLSILMLPDYVQINGDSSVVPDTLLNLLRNLNTYCSHVGSERAS